MGKLNNNRYRLLTTTIKTVTTMKKIILSAAIVAAALVSCSKTEIADAPTYTKDVIDFGTYVGTKAEVSNFDNADSKFVIDAYLSGAEDLAEATDTPVQFMDNQLVTKNSDNTSWTYSPTKYWPEDLSSKISFFAASVGTEDLPTFNDLSAENQASFTYTSNVASDLLVASVFNQSRNDSQTVDFKFSHALAKIAVTAKSDMAYSDATITITGIELKYADNFTNVGEFTFAKASTESNTWTPSTTQGTYLVSASSTPDLAVSDVAQAVITPMMVIPQSNDITATITYTVKTADNSTITNTKEFTISPAAGNTIYTYNVTISLDAVLVSATVSDWGEPEVSEDIK